MSESDHHYRFFQNRACEYFPCHEGVDEANFNCLFCFCPLYALGRKCGGRCVYNEANNKVCSDCTFPHHRENYDRIMARYDEIMETVRLNDQLNPRSALSSDQNRS